MSEWGDTCLSTTVVSLRYKNPTKRVDLVQSGPNHHFIENLKQTLFTYISCEAVMTPGFQSKEWVSDSCLALDQQFFSYIMARKWAAIYLCVGCFDFASNCCDSVFFWFFILWTQLTFFKCSSMTIMVPEIT
jgi:hypothetical protein